MCHVALLRSAPGRKRPSRSALGRILLFKVLGAIVRTSRAELREEHLDGIEQRRSETASPNAIRHRRGGHQALMEVGSGRVPCAKVRDVLPSALLNVEQIVALQGITVSLRRTCSPPRRCLNPSRCLLTLRTARQVAARHLCALLGAIIEKGSP